MDEAGEAGEEEVMIDDEVDEGKKKKLRRKTRRTNTFLQVPAVVYLRPHAW